MNSRPLTTGITLALILCLSGCASGGSSDSGPPRSGDTITAEDLAQLGQVTLLQAVRELRPGWLRSRSMTSVNTTQANIPQVILDRQPYGDWNALRDIPIIDVASIRYLPAREATTLYGPRFTGGVFDVRTKR